MAGSGTFVETALVASAIFFSSTSTSATSRSLAARPGLPLPCPPQPMTAMPSFSLGARDERMVGAPNAGEAAAVGFSHHRGC